MAPLILRVIPKRWKRLTRPELSWHNLHYFWRTYISDWFVFSALGNVVFGKWLQLAWSKQEDKSSFVASYYVKIIVSLIHTSPCTNVNCLCNIPKRIIYTDLKIPDICDKCKSDIARDGWFETLPKIESERYPLQQLAGFNPSKTMTLNIEQCIDQPQSNIQPIN